MTIAVAIRTGSAVVFAADSKLTTQAIAGIEEDGSPRWVEQTYDNATKVVHDRNRTLMAIIAGPVNIGRASATDFIATQTFPREFRSLNEQDGRIADVVAAMVAQKRDYWTTTQVPPGQWPGPTLLLAAPSSNNDVPRVWRVDLSGPEAATQEILEIPGIRLEGAYAEVFGLLYGYEPRLFSGICAQLQVEPERMTIAIENSRELRPIDKLSLWSMPVQDAIDMAVFLAAVQVHMDRFLPGTPACGGPIDVMVLQMAPEPGIVAYPGKVLHHPENMG